MDKVTNAVLQSGTIQSNMNIILGLSGGPDSLCLLHVLMKLRKSVGFAIIPVHVNHKLRKNASKEQKHIEKICKDMGIECNSYSVDCKKIAEEMGMSLEEAGRYARYQVFDEVARKLVEEGAAQGSVVIATAHNADDQSETVLFRVVRGTGISGLTGMRAIRLSESGFPIIRPLLRVPRADIEEYIRANDLNPNLDESNYETDAARNKIRLELIPYIEENINSNVKENLRRLADNAAIDNDCLERLAFPIYVDAAEADTVKQSIILHTDKLIDQHVAIIRRVIAALLRDLGMDQELSLNLVNGVMEVMFSDNPSAHADLPGGLSCDREYRQLRFHVSKDPVQASSERALAGLRLMKQVIDYPEYLAENARLYAAFDYDEFNKTYPGQLSGIVLRTRQSGDFIAIAGGKRKKLQDYFVDSKIPKLLRDEIPVVAIGSEVLWIPPHNSLPSRVQREKGKYSQNYQINNSTKEVLFLEIVDSL